LSDDSYWYHVYLSYDRGGPEEGWLERFFLVELRTWLRLELELSEAPQIFSDHDANRAVWDTGVTEAIRHSCCLVPILTPSYWRSSECLAELESFRARQRNENVAVTLGVLFHDSGRAPSGDTVSCSDFTSHAYVYEGFATSAKYGPFQDEVKV